MQKFVYPRDYLSINGNIQHCWEVHKRVMKERGLPFVDYFSFYNRVKRYDWDLYRAIHAPLDTSRMSGVKKFKIGLRTGWFRFIYLFKKHDRRRRS